MRLYDLIKKTPLNRLEESESIGHDRLKHDYMMLSRYKSDLDYYFGHGGRSDRNLYFHDFKTHMDETIKLWKSLEEKPEWLTASELKNYVSMYKSGKDDS